MPASSGPNTLGESNLVFAYDTGDVSNSYIGAPTTNICTGADYSIYNDGASNVRNQTYPPPFKPGYEVVKVTANTPGTYGQSILWTATYSSSPTTATNSVYAWLESGTYVQVGQHWHPWNYGSPKYIEKGKWVRISETYAINEGGSYSAAAMVYSTDGVAYFCMPQYELKPYMTPFINFLGTRSATQGLLPVIGNSTIDLTNVSFNSNAQMVFDGTNDYASVTLPSSIGVYCLEMVWYNNNAIPNNDTAIGGPTTYQTPIEFNGTGQGVHLGAWTGGFTNEAIHIWGAGGATANQVAAGVGHHHVVFNWNGTTYDIWVDGINTPTQYLSGNNPATLLTASSIKMGNDVSGYAFNGQIPITKIYNRALTAQEVRQNYQQYKTRFNLS